MGRCAGRSGLEDRSLWRLVYLMYEDILGRVESVEESITMDARGVGNWHMASEGKDLA